MTSIYSFPRYGAARLSEKRLKLRKVGNEHMIVRRF